MSIGSGTQASRWAPGMGLVVALASASVSAAPETGEAPSPRVALTPIETRSLPAPEVDRLERVVRETLRESSIEALDLAQAKCVRAACRRKQARERGASWVLALAVEEDNRDFSAKVELRDVAGSRPPIELEFECLICGVDEFATQLAETVDVLAETALLVAEADGQGEPGHDRGRRSVRLGWARPVAIASLGLGLASIGAGATMLVLDGRDVPGRCRSPSDPGVIDFDGDCQWVYRTRAPGAAALAFGLVGAAVGSAVLIVERKACARGRNCGEALSASLSTAGLSLRF